MDHDPVPIAVYRRSVAASSERVWENVHDWEHLPWLHSESFASIALEESGDWGWRARIGLQPASAGNEIRLELVVGEGGRYVSRTLEGPGAGNEIWTTVTPVDETQTDIEVEFRVVGVAAERQDEVGRSLVSLYTRLWDEDEAMMQHRTRRLADGAPGEVESVDLGPIDALHERLPLVVEFGGRSMRVVEHEGGLVAHSTRCPHWLGPLDEAVIEDGQVVCPWHGYRFDLVTGKGCGVAERLRLAPAPRVEVEGGRVRLVAGSR